MKNNAKTGRLRGCFKKKNHNKANRLLFFLLTLNLLLSRFIFEVETHYKSSFPLYKNILCTTTALKVKKQKKPTKTK